MSRHRHRYKQFDRGFNSDLDSQNALLRDIIYHSELWNILTKGNDINLPRWHLGAGCIAQTIWNYLSGFPLLNNIEDADIAYFDPDDLSAESEKKHEDRVREMFAGFPLKFNVKNQARVHQWYPKRFGYEIAPYHSIEDAINTWPTTATSIGIHYSKAGFTIYAPYGLNDLFGMIVRPNKMQIIKEIYEQKVRRWQLHWPRLKIIDWDMGKWTD